MENKKIKFVLFSKEDYTDKSVLDFLINNNDFSVSEYSEFLLNRNLTNKLANKIIEFLCFYDDGFLKPDKCNAYEPINKPFNENDLSTAISWLSQPGGGFYFKKEKQIKIDGAIENNRFAPIWDNKKLLKPLEKEPLYLGEIRLFLDERLINKKGVQYWIDFMQAFARISLASAGILLLYNEEIDYTQLHDHEILITDNVRNIFSKRSINF